MFNTDDCDFTAYLVLYILLVSNWERCEIMTVNILGFLAVFFCPFSDAVNAGYRQ